MQRWMFYAVLGLLGLMLLAGGGYWGLHEYRLGRPGPRWVPLPLNYSVSMERQKELAGEIEEKLRKDELLRKIVVDAKLVDGFKVASEDAALAELKRRMFVRVGAVETEKGKLPSIDIGVEGTRRERAVLDEASSKLMREVWMIMGVDPDTGKAIQGRDPAVPAGGF